jgi:hypothetical protein
MRNLLTLAVLAMTLAGCPPIESTYEVENPREFYVIAEYEGPDGRYIFEDYGAKLRCQPYDSDSDGRRRTNRGSDGECLGTYALLTTGGPTIMFVDESHMARGARPTTENGGLKITFHGAVGEGEAFISHSEHLPVNHGWDFARDVAGGFDARIGPHSFTRGFFYSIAPEDN